MLESSPAANSSTVAFGKLPCCVLGLRPGAEVIDGVDVDGK